ncbi:MAG: hypothetical protein RJA07_373 [Bacteroidota bacterium]|jgi:hypothetical protein
MAWFDFLKAEGYFDPNKNPEPVQVKEGFQIPYWEALGYLEKLALQIKEGSELELVDELLAVIKNVSEHPKDNYRTWYLLIKFLACIPNEKIPIEIFNFIPVWLSGRFDTSLQTSEICEQLLPKFLNEAPTEDDTKKAELILHYLFQVKRTDRVEEGIWDGEGESYYSRLHLHFLAERFERRNLTPKVAEHCSANFMLELGRTIKFLLLDYPKGVNTLLKDGEKEYEIKILIEKENLLVSSKLKDSEVANATSTITNWEDKSDEDLKQQLVSIFQQQNIRYTPTQENDDTFQRLNFALNNDLTSAFGLSSIRKLDDRYSNNGKVLNVFSLIFRDILDEKAKQNPEEAIGLLKVFCYDKKYKMPFYKRIALYVVCENWNTTKSLFWDLIKDNDALHLFSKYKYQKELYDLLNKNQQSLTDEEKNILQNIIAKGEQDEVNEQDEKRKEYWEFRWCSALKEIEPFKEKYLSLSHELEITNEHYENLGEIRVRSGSVSPISKDDLLEKSNQEISEFIRTFKPKDRWEDPNISGLSDTFGSAVETQPEKFADEIELYFEVGYVYSYRMLNAFSEAWKKKKSFNWQKVLQYCLDTLKSDKFYSGQLLLENDTWAAKPDWVVGSIAHLITDGLQNDKNSFDISLLPLAKEIVQILVSNLERVDDLKETNMDYPTYSLNSTAGKSLRALFDYSLHRARNLFKYEDKGKWEPEIQSLFEGTIQKGILDGHILEGMYFEQFYFLDKGWITEQVKQHYDSAEREWLAFMGGFAFSSAPMKKELYNLFYPHYERVIENNIKLKPFHNNGLVRHLTAFYFWKFETLTSDKLLLKFLNKSTPDGIRDFISFISQQEDYQKSLTEVEQKEFQQLILELWNYLVDKYKDTQNEEEQNNLAMLANWIVFAPELNDTYTKLILHSCNHIDKTYSTHELVENLVALKNKGNPNVVAKSIGEIISSLNFRDYMADFDKDFLKDLVSFLFVHGQNQVAAEFCNKIAAVHQQFFLREIYEKYVK